MNRLIFLFMIFLSIFGCKKTPQQPKIPVKSDIFGLATPVKLDIDTTTIILRDFFVNPEIIDSIEYDKNLSVLFSKDKQKIKLKVLSDSLPKLSTLTLHTKNGDYSILLKKSDKIKYEFIFDPHGKSYNSVAIMGEMNAWNPGNSPLKFDKGVWSIDFEISPGEYQYLLVIDGKQQLDPNNSDSVSNNMGGFNSLLKAGKPDSVFYINTISHTENSIKIGFPVKTRKLIVFYQNTELGGDFISIKNNTAEIRIPEQAKNIKRSYIRAWAYSKNGLSNDIKIPLEYGKVIDDASLLTRTDYEGAVIYNVFVDRFFDGNPQNNRPINNPQLVNPKADFQGGDIAGIIQKAEQGFFDSLGVNTVWISPIVKNVEGAYGHWANPETKFSAYHGYWPVSLTQIDDRFGTPQEFKQLVENLHNTGKNLLLDFVAHHVHEEAPLYKEHKDWTTNLYLPDGSLNTERWDDHRLTTWFDVFLPTLDNSRPEVYNLVSDSAVWWVKTYDIDGFRHDAAKHVPLVFWRTLTYKLKSQIEIPQDKRLYQIGETYGTPELISSYVNSGMLDAQFDFNVYDAISTALAVGNSFKSVENQLVTSFKYYGWHNLMGYITGNQDRGRFISYAGGALSYEEDAKLAGWTRDVGVGDTVAYKKSAMLFAFITTIPGIPVIYYGDEIGIPGGNDPDSRRMMKFENLTEQEQNLRETAAKLIKLRRNYMPLIFGDFRFLLVEDKVMAYQRQYFGKKAIVIFNNSDTPQEITISLRKSIGFNDFMSLFGNKFSVKSDNLIVSLPANSFEILIN